MVAAPTSLDLLSAALEYAGRGLPVLPLHSVEMTLDSDTSACTCGRECPSPAKHPLVLHGKDDATIDTAVIRGWWERWPEANVGLRPVRGLVVLDVDPRNAGDVTLAELEQQHGELPRARTAITGSDGLHLWFRGTATVGKLGEGLDVKDHRGYVVAPPSIHICGGQYLWTDENPAVPAPAWLAQLLSPPPPPRRPMNPATAGTQTDVNPLLAVVLRARQGGRNAALFWSATRLWERVADGRLADDQVEAMLLDAALAVGLGDHEARATIASARRSVIGA